MNISRKFQKANSYLPFLGLIALIVLYIPISFIIQNESSSQKKFNRFQKQFLEQQQLLFSKTKDVEDILLTHPEKSWPLLEKATNAENIYAQIYKEGLLVFWNSQHFNNEFLLNLNTKADTIVKLSTGWFLIHTSLITDFKIYLIKQIKSEHEYENSFLPNNLNPEFGNIDGLEFTTDFNLSQFIIQDTDGHNVIGLIFEENIRQRSSFVILFVVYLLIYFVLFILLRQAINGFKQLKKREVEKFISFLLIFIGIRLVDFYALFPMGLKTSFIFSPYSAEIAGWNTAGDFVINSLILFAIAYKLYTLRLNTQYTENKALKTGYMIICSLLAVVITFIILVAVYNGIINMELNSLVGIKLLNVNSIFKLSGILFLGISLYLFISAYLNAISKMIGSFYTPIVINAIIGVIFYLLFQHFGFQIVISVGFVIVASVISNYQTRSQDILIIKFILIAILFAVVGSLVINHAIRESKNQHQVEMANLLTESRDAKLESYFNEVELQLGNDRRLKNIIFKEDENPDDELNNYLNEKYFKDFTKKYQIQITLCEEGELLEVKDNGLIYDCSSFFEGLISNPDNARINQNLFLVENQLASVYYLGRFELVDTIRTEKRFNLFIEFYYSYIPEGLGYPELLIDNSAANIDLSGYSFGFYEDDELSLKFGDFPFHTNISFIKEFSNNHFFVMSSFTHYKIQLENNKCLVISRQNVRLSEQIVSFSVVFLCFMVITFIVLTIIFGKQTRTQLALSFRNRLQILFVSTISFVIALLALITLYYVETNNENKLREQLSEKTVSVLIELDHKLSGDTTLYQNDESYLIDLLKKFSMVFFSDINLYNSSGQIIASSRPEIFQRGLLSENINPLAFEELFVKNRLNYITKESIGEATYYSSYMPLNLNNGQTVGILNLPYFAKQSEVRKAYFLMLFTFINLFVIFWIIGALLGLFLSRILAKPLFLLQESIGNIRIDTKNEKIEWDRDDEIGQLIAEYNRMVDKLEQSAEILKHSERENTWREVARQIAHEIKNPLTPMKLNVQYLEKAYDEKDPDFDKKVKNISALLITQIDALNKVAEMFSDFAKSNVGNFTNVDLQKIIRSAVSLFKSHEHIDFQISIEHAEDEYVVKAIEKDLLRVFNNLLKNAIQSLEGKEGSQIEVALFKENNQVVASVKDNGKGIPAEARANIFQPYFTTKSGGTGLGLAIVKNIMSEIGGEISCEPNPTGGTIFKLKFRQTF